MESLRNELEETKELVLALQNITMDNSQKLLSLSINDEQVLDGFEETLDDTDNADNADIVTEYAEDMEASVTSIINLKELVKQEFNLEA